MFHDMDTHRQYHKYRARELYHRADQERLALEISRANHRIRFYYPALAKVGRWLMNYGLRLHQRYGEHCDFAVTPSQPARRNA